MKHKTLIFNYEDQCEGGCSMIPKPLVDCRDGSNTQGRKILVIQCKSCNQVIIPAGITVETEGLSDELVNELNECVAEAFTEINEEKP